MVQILLSKNRPGDVKIITDFLPHHSKEELYGMVDRWSESFGNRKLKDFFGGILNGKVVAFIARKLSMAADKSVAKVDKADSITLLIMQRNANLILRAVQDLILHRLLPAV